MHKFTRAHVRILNLNLIKKKLKEKTTSRTTTRPDSIEKAVDAVRRHRIVSSRKVKNNYLSPRISQNLRLHYLRHVYCIEKTLFLLLKTY